MEVAATLAVFHGKTLYEYISHLRKVREEYGEEAAQLDMRFSIELRHLRAVKEQEAKDRQG